MEDCQSRSGLTRNLRNIKEISNFQSAKKNKINITEMTMSEVSKRQDHHYARLVTSRDVLVSHLVLIQKQRKCGKLYKVKTDEGGILTSLKSD